MDHQFSLADITQVDGALKTSNYAKYITRTELDKVSQQS